MKGCLKRALFVLAAVLPALIHGCYTTFSHPLLTDEEGGRVSVREDCSACHESGYRPRAVLPKAAEEDDDWLFYSASPWWQDAPQRFVETAPPPETTGPRTVGGSFYEAPATVPPAVPTVQTLSKSAAAPDSSSAPQIDNRRPFERRSDVDGERESTGSRSRRQ